MRRPSPGVHADSRNAKQDRPAADFYAIQILLEPMKGPSAEEDPCFPACRNDDPDNVLPCFCAAVLLYRIHRSTEILKHRSTFLCMNIAVFAEPAHGFFDRRSNRGLRQTEFL